jgi:formylglycine-generating enzyme required for sulfatase activity
VRSAGALALLSLSALLAACAAVEGAPTRTDGAMDVAGMVPLPGGTFRAGELTGPLRDQVTYHRVRPFLLDATEVTVAAYARCVKSGKCKPAAATVKWDMHRERELSEWSALCNQDRGDRADHPVNCVDWNQARAFCAWAGKRLPAEHEWEWAARNGKEASAYPWGNEPPLEQGCWDAGAAATVARGRLGTCPVGSHPEGDTASGLEDLAGNVWEWTSSRDVFGADSRGRGGTTVNVARGGGWYGADARSVSAAARLLELPTRRNSDLGFRCAKSL